MNLDHLGDALDYWKGSIINVIAGRGLRVVPMLTDRTRWTEEHFEAYARLLHRNPDNVLRKSNEDIFSSETRHSYFCNLGRHDLFLDPDTGIATDKKAKKEHISLSDIVALLRDSRSRMLLIYQHASRDKDGLRKKLELLRSTYGLKECCMFAYDSGAVSMVVISQNRERTDKALARLKSWLGPASSRIVE